jgi:hypothetical protein
LGAKAATVGTGVVQGGHDGTGAEAIFAEARDPVRDKDKDKDRVRVRDALAIEVGEGVGVGIAGEGREIRDGDRIGDRVEILRMICPRAFTSI